jgi:hypothetical protein
MSLAFVPHATYLAVITLPLAAFAVSGALGARALYSRGSRVWAVLPALILVQTGWATWVSATGGGQLRWLAPIIAVVGFGAAVVLVVRRVRPTQPGVRGSRASIQIGIAGALIAALAGPVAWSLCVLGPGGGGSASDAFAGPRPSTAAHTPVAPVGIRLRPPFTSPPVSGLDREQRRLVDYVTARNSHGSLAFATDTMAIAVSVILWTHEKPMPMGGFSQRAPTPRLATLQALIESNRLRFVLLADLGRGQPAPTNPTVAADRVWVRQHCAAVLSGRFRDGKSARQTLYDCASAQPAASDASPVRGSAHEPQGSRALAKLRPETVAGLIRT